MPMQWHRLFHSYGPGRKHLLPLGRPEETNCFSAHLSRCPREMRCGKPHPAPRFRGLRATPPTRGVLGSRMCFSCSGRNRQTPLCADALGRALIRGGSNVGLKGVRAPKAGRGPAPAWRRLLHPSPVALSASQERGEACGAELTELLSLLLLTTENLPSKSPTPLVAWC